MNNDLHRARHLVRIVSAIACAGALSACGDSGGQQAGGGPGGRGGGQPVEVGFVVMHAASVPVETELAGRTTAFQTSEVRPQVSGIIQRRLFDEGAQVEAGETLYQIDDSLYRAAAAEAAANLDSARASAEAARALADRYKPLAEIEAVSRQAFADAEAAARKAEAAVAQTQAQLDRAQINLRYTKIAAPISGQIGRSLFTEGALVTANQNDPLAVIQLLDPMFVDIQQSSADLLGLRRALASGGMVATTADVRLKLEDGSIYEQRGTVEFAEATVNESTGTVTLRASVPNPDGLLLPGMFVRALFSQGTEEDAFLTPQVSLTRDGQGQAMVWVVGDDETAQRRMVETDRIVGDTWVVTAGLEEGDRVIVEGTGKLTPGAKVIPVPAGTPDRMSGGVAGPMAGAAQVAGGPGGGATAAN